jgi:hypothetical protein
MADSVDTMIENSYNRAISWGSTADWKSYDAVHGVDSFDPLTGLWGRKNAGGVLPVKVPQPPKYAGIPTLPTTPTLAQMQAFRQALQNMLDAFFGAYFAPADAYAAAEAWVLDALSTDDPKLPGTNLDLIWNRAQNYTQALGNDLTGLDIPTEALTPHATPAYAAFAHAEAYARSSIKVDLWQHAAALKLRDLRAEAITATGEYIRALSSTDAVVVGAQTSILEAETRMKTAAASWYMAQLGPTVRDTERTTTSVTEDRTDEIIGDDLKAQYSELAVKAAISGSQAVAMAASAATASLNSIISSSTAGFE